VNATSWKRSYDTSTCQSPGGNSQPRPQSTAHVAALDGKDAELQDPTFELNSLT
jgi:hypothetical protein